MQTQPAELNRAGRGGFGGFVLLAAAVVIVAATTALVFWEARKAQLSRFYSQFESDASDRTAVIQQEADESLFAIKSFRSFLTGAGEVDRAAVEGFAAVCLPERKELQALAWIPAVPASAREDFEQGARLEGLGSFRIFERDGAGRSIPAKKRSIYYPVLLIEPLAGNEQGTGFDAGSDPVRLIALERARDTSRAVVSEPIQLVQGAPGEQGFLIVAPVYRRGMAWQTVEQRRASLRGFAAGVYRPNVLVQVALQQLKPIDISLSVIDPSANPEQQLLFSQTGTERLHFWQRLLYPAPPEDLEQFTFADQLWQVRARAGQEYIEQHCPLSYWLVLPAGVVMAFLAGQYVRRMLMSREQLERLAAERTAALRQTQEMLRLILDSIPVRVHWKNTESVYMGCNRNFARDAELNSTAEIVGKTDYDLPWKEFAELFRGRDQQVIKTGKPMLNYEQPRTSSDGRLFCLLQSKLPLRDVHGNIIGVLSAYDDITSRKEAEKALRESETRYRAVVEHAPDGVAVAINDKIVYVNPAAVRIAGAREESELLGHSILEFVPEDYREQVARRRAAVLAQHEASSVLELKLRRLDGQLIDAESVPVPILFGGEWGILNYFRDVTEHRRREEALRASEARYRQLHESMRDAFVAIDLSGRVTDFNESFRQMLGYEHEELMQLTPEDFSPERWHGLDSEVRQTQVLTRGYSDIYQKEYRRKDGTVFPVEVRSILLRDDSGRSYGSWAIVRDISARKRAEEALRQSREQLRQRAEEVETIMNNAPVALWVAHDPQCNEVTGNAKANEFDGCGPQTNWSANVATRNRWLRDGRQLKPEELPMQQAARNNTEVQNAELELVLPSGGQISLVGSAAPLRDAAGHVRGCVGAFLDNTDRKRAKALLAGEKRILEMIARQNPLKEVLTEMCRFIEDASPGMMSSILLLAEDGKHLKPIAAPSLPEIWTRAIDPLAIGPCVGSCGTAAWTRKQVVVADITTDRRWTDAPDLCALAVACGLRACWSTPILGADTQPLGTFAMYYREPRNPSARDLEIIRQITHLASIAIEHHRATDALRHAHAELEQRVQERTAELVAANQRLEELDRLKSQFLATMSHELRTPLNSIIGFAGILRAGFAGPVNEEQNKQLGMVLGSGKHLLSLINDLLDLSRIEAGKVEVAAEPFNFVEVVQEVVDTLRPMADQKQLHLRADLPEPVIEMIGDRTRCYQVLLNLANNAVKFTERGEVTISAGAGVDMLRVAVCDTGIGIKAEQMGMLFEAFRQLDGTAKRMYEGTGLGLHLCRKLLGLMHGNISVKSQPGKGSCFTFTLPRRAGPKTATQKADYESAHRG